MVIEIHNIEIGIKPIQTEINLEIRVEGEKEEMTVEIIRSNEMIFYRPNIDIGINRSKDPEGGKVGKE